jgi:hexosaminidase
MKTFLHEDAVKSGHGSTPVNGPLTIIAVTLQLAACLFAQAAAAPAAAPPFIPQPAQVQMRSGSFTLSRDTAIVYAEGLEGVAKLAASQLGLRTVRSGSTEANAINLVTGRELRLEGYRLDVSTDRITIVGGSRAGVFYGVQTLRQTLPQGPLTQPATINCLSITDQPRFCWRGLMLDCSRTFQSIDYLKKTIDRIAFYKMNVLHLHLTDDQGWRMEIRKHPELTRKGARFSAKYAEPERYQGFYTQDQLRDLIEYASLRGVTIVPEIELPGHAMAAMVCRPDLSCPGKIPDDIFPYSKGPNGVEWNARCVFCAGNDDSFRFLEEVLDEVMQVFPSMFVHIGGDEVGKANWSKCPKCQARIKAEGLNDVDGLQSYFIRRIEKHINDKGRRMIGWSEILQGGLAPNAAVMDWIGGADPATRAGHDVVMSPTSHCYFDYPYTAIDEKLAYGFDPVARLSATQAAHVLGLQANFWSHIDREPPLVDRQLYPRLLSLAERAWSPATTTDWPSFSARLGAHLPRLLQMDASYHGMPAVEERQRDRQ